MRSRIQGAWHQAEHSHHKRYWLEGQLHHQRCVMSNHWQLNHGGELMVKIGPRYYILGLILKGHANSVTVNRQNVKEITGQSDWSCVTSLEESDDQHRKNVNESFNIFDDFNAPAHSSDEPFTSYEAMPPVQVQSPQEPSKAEIELHNLTHMPFRSWSPSVSDPQVEEINRRQDQSLKWTMPTSEDLKVSQAEPI
eukprot:1015711-Amphidinium_carterae.4